jgi:hypothetical protein
MESTLYIGVESIYAKYRFENASIAQRKKDVMLE